MLTNLQMKTISIPAPSATIGSQVQTKKAAHTIGRSQKLNILIEYGVGILCSFGLGLCGALMFVFGLFLLEGWCIVLGIVFAVLGYVLLTNKEDGELSIKEAIEALATGKEVSK